MNIYFSQRLGKMGLNMLLLLHGGGEGKEKTQVFYISLKIAKGRVKIFFIKKMCLIEQIPRAGRKLTRIMKTNIGLSACKEALIKLYLVGRSVNNVVSEIKITFVKVFPNAPTLKKGEWLENIFTSFARVYVVVKTMVKCEFNILIWLGKNYG
ncbi:hypothetical protein HY448_01665 [Candidatus Pacearchaeota archaeon]|nr:hypothetical protein [Candidatus Pacearchaeota archaeon]